MTPSPPEVKVAFPTHLYRPWDYPDTRAELHCPGCESGWTLRNIDSSFTAAPRMVDAGSSSSSPPADAKSPPLSAFTRGAIGGIASGLLLQVRHEILVHSYFACPEHTYATTANTTTPSPPPPPPPPPPRASTHTPKTAIAAKDLAAVNHPWGGVAVVWPAHGLLCGCVRVC